MSRIHEKLGLKPGGKRAFMKLPDDRTTRVRLTAAKCPACGNRGANLSRRFPGWFVCSWCNHSWEPAS